MYRIFFLVCIFFSTHSIFAQSVPDTLHNDHGCLKFMPVIIKTSPLAPLYKYQMVTLGAEVPVHNTISAGFEAGYIYGHNDLVTKVNRGKHSFDFRLDAKYYFVSSSSLRLYTGPLLTHRQLNLNRGELKSYPSKNEAGEDIIVYYVEMDDPTSVKINTVNVMWQAGVQPIILDRFALNVFTGLGLGIERVAETKNGTAIHPDDYYFDALIGFNLGYAF